MHVQICFCHLSVKLHINNMLYRFRFTWSFVYVQTYCVTSQHIFFGQKPSVFRLLIVGFSLRFWNVCKYPPFDVLIFDSIFFLRRKLNRCTSCWCFSKTMWHLVFFVTRPFYFVISRLRTAHKVCFNYYFNIRFFSIKVLIYVDLFGINKIFGWK